MVAAVVHNKRLSEAGTFGPKFSLWTMIPEYGMAYEA